MSPRFRLQPILPQPLRQWAHHRLVLRAVAEENVVLEIVGHGYSPLGLAFRATAKMASSLAVTSGASLSLGTNPART